MCVCVRLDETVKRVWIRGGLLKEYAKCSLRAQCKHSDTHTIAHPTVTALPSSLHRQLGPARFLFRGNGERRRGGDGGGGAGRMEASEAHTETRSDHKCFNSDLTALRIG